MGRRLFWFAVGVGVTAWLVVKGREYYEKFTPKGVTATGRMAKSGRGFEPRSPKSLPTS